MNTLENILHDEIVKNAIKEDVKKTHLIDYKKTWKLGVITPDTDHIVFVGTGMKRMDMLKQLSHVEQLPLKKTAILYAPVLGNFLRTHTLTITGGDVKRIYSTWCYKLETKVRKGESFLVKEIKIAASALFRAGLEELQESIRQRKDGMPIFEFLIKQGFPLKEHYDDGDPLTTERGGIIVVSMDNPTIIHPEYFVQRSLIDDEGNMIYIGLDASRIMANTVEIKPFISKKLAKLRFRKGYRSNEIFIRYHSFPYQSESMLPILDTPVSANLWGELAIDPQGGARLFMAKYNESNEWVKMMGKLRELFVSELNKKDNHLLGLTKDKTHLDEYLKKKEDILKNYYDIEDLGNFFN